MSIWNKILIGFVLIAGLGFSYMAIRTLKTHAHWRSLAEVYQLFLDKENYITTTQLHGGRELAIGGDPDAKAALGELQEFFRNREYTALSLKADMDWADFKKQVSQAVAKTSAVDIGLIDSCISMTRASAAPEPAEEESEEEREMRGIKELRLALHRIYIDRGRAWEQTEPQRPDPQTGQVVVGVSMPEPHGITDKMVLYAFEQSDGRENPEYLGEFKVTGVAEGQIQMQPTMEMTQVELERLSRSNGPWILYERMPVDRHQLFADYDEDQLRAMLPESSLTDYLKDGQQASWGDVADWGVNGDVVDESGKPLVDEEGQPLEGVQGTFVRRLRDYELIFQGAVADRVEFVDLIAAAERDKKYMEAAAADAARQEQFRRQHLQEVEAKLQKVARERDAVSAHQRRLQAKVAAVGQTVDQLMASNKATAGRIAEIQLEAARRIDARTPPARPATAAGN